jgi:hypothetical protein
MPTTPGIHSSCSFADFDVQEKTIIETISKDWYVTNSGNLLTFNQNVSYKFILVKLTDNLQHAFNLERDHRRAGGVGVSSGLEIADGSFADLSGGSEAIAEGTGRGGVAAENVGWAPCIKIDSTAFRADKSVVGLPWVARSSQPRVE